jgi:hypothetical protein
MKNSKAFPEGNMTSKGHKKNGLPICSACGPSLLVKNHVNPKGGFVSGKTLPCRSTVLLKNTEGRLSN